MIFRQRDDIVYMVDGELTRIQYVVGGHAVKLWRKEVLRVTDVKALQSKIKDSGLKKTFIAEQLGLSYPGYLNKETGKTEFMASEIVTMSQLLHMSEDETKGIFLSKELTES